MTCSGNGLDVLTYSTTQYNAEVIPAWIVDDYDNFLLNGTAPAQTTNTTHYFNIESAYSGWGANEVKNVVLNVFYNSS